MLKGMGSLIYTDMQQWQDILSKKKKRYIRTVCSLSFLCFLSVGGNVYTSLGRMQLYLAEGSFSDPLRV